MQSVAVICPVHIRLDEAVYLLSDTGAEHRRGIGATFGVAVLCCSGAMWRAKHRTRGCPPLFGWGESSVVRRGQRDEGGPPLFGAVTLYVQGVIVESMFLHLQVGIVKRESSESCRLSWIRRMCSFSKFEFLPFLRKNCQTGATSSRSVLSENAKILNLPCGAADHCVSSRISNIPHISSSA